MARGYKTGGRRKGTPNKVTAAQRDAIAASGETPLEYMLRIMRDASVPAERRDEMAKAAASFCHPKLSATAIEQTRADDNLFEGMSSLDVARRAAFLLTFAGEAVRKDAESEGSTH